MTDRKEQIRIFARAARVDLEELGWAGPFTEASAREVQQFLRNQGQEVVVEPSRTTLKGEWFELVRA